MSKAVTEEKEVEEKKSRKIVGYVIDGFLGLLIVFILSVMIQMLMSQNNPRNYGVPVAYGHSFLYVVTDSMDGTYTDKDYPIPSFPAESGVVLKKVDPSEIKEGDVVTFYEIITIGGQKMGIINTHRIMSQPDYGKEAITIDESGVYHFHTVGDNSRSESGSYQSRGEDFTQDYLIGKVVSVSRGLGWFLSWASPTASGYHDAKTGGNSSWFFPVMILIPVAIIATTSIISTVKTAKRENAKEQALLEAAMDEAGIDRNNEVEVEKFTAKFFFKLEYREKFEAEKEKIKKVAKKEYEKAKKKARKEIEKEQRKAAKENAER